MPQVSLSTSTNFDGDRNALVEDQGTALTVRFDLDEPAPEGGLKVYVDSEIEQIVNRLDLVGFAGNPTVENINPNLLGTNFDNSGFFLTIDAGATTASFTIDVFDNPEPDTFLPATFDGLVEAAFALRVAGEVEQADLADVGTLGDYTVDPDGATSTVLFADEASQLAESPEPPPTPPTGPPTSGLPLVSLNTGPDFLVEEEGTVSAHVFNVTGATIPEEGLLVSVSAPGLNEFDLDGINVSEGGEIVGVREDGFDILLTDFTVLVDLPVAADGEAEGLETASFSLEVGDGYEVNEAFSSGSFDIADTTNEIPAGALNQRNDTLPEAISLDLNEAEPTFLTTSIEFDIGNRYLNDDGTYTYIDATEDVDFYSFELEEGDLIGVDADSWLRGDPPEDITEFVFDSSRGPFISQRIFDSAGQELSSTWAGQGPGELFVSRDSYTEFVAPEDGTYYLGISNQISGSPDSFVDLIDFPNAVKYDPFIPGLGDNDLNFGNGQTRVGEYDLTIALNPEIALELPQFFDGNGAIDSSNGESSDAAPGSPTVSLDAATFTLDPDTENVVNSYLTEGTAITNSILFLTLETEGEIPEEGILVNVNSDNYLRQYVTRRSLFSPPFSPGSDLETVIYDETGRETGFQLRVFEPNAFVTLSAQSIGWADNIEPDVEAPEDVTWSLESGEGYAVDSEASEINITYYDPEQVPETTVIPEIEISLSETELIESEGTETALTFTLSEPPPEQGVVVRVSGSSAGLLPQFDISNIKVDGGVFPSPDGDFRGFYFKITEQEASISLPVFEDPFDEGLQEFSFSLVESPSYSIGAGGEATFTIADTPDSVVEVSLSSESETLVESENSMGVLTFNLTADPTAEGVTVNVDAPELSEFDVAALTVAGGEITETTDSGFSLNITDATATVELPVLADGETEGLETATFSLSEAVGSTINPDTNEATLTLADNSNQVPVTEEIDANDTISQADDLNLNLENSGVTVRGGISSLDPGQGFRNNNDFSEDVDLYTLNLEAGDTVKLDVDAVGGLELSLYEGVDLRLDSELRVFDADGNELASNNNAAAPDEEFSRDPYLEFTAESAGTYYVGISQLGNNNYDPNVEGSGSGWVFPEIGVFSGEYDLNVSLTSGDTPDLDIIGTDGDDTLSGDAGNNTLDGLAGNDTLAGGLGNDIILGGDGDDILRGDENSRNPQDDVMGGNDIIFGGEGSDRIGGKSGNDILSGDAGDDFIWGDDGDDIIMGSAGNDILVGDNFSNGSGSDLFVFGNGDGTDTILDFEVGIDRIGLVEGELMFADLTITQDGSTTLLGVASSGETLAILNGVQASSLTESSFEVVADVSNLEEAIALI
ncbi:calcium-binding protein [cf. Phormidesmis sp. LEGE 11477]|uniref:calcium-binding protein n=1 Tax=cf. Phormidesmis sp. LEGE 11477 TaxID=1828680 RepID=UPI00187F037B|nr:pre-peptidase C-terminal domain-containing protein [cf. Phormidesmis sp. LEGE 11477]MBE9064024.1 pre-peptidase C-terminal domain-containing protein [cf. Phormidesmis sp. LEGE 11477]